MDIDISDITEEEWRDILSFAVLNITVRIGILLNSFKSISEPFDEFFEQFKFDDHT